MKKFLFLWISLLFSLLCYSQDDSKKVVAVQALFFEEPLIDSVWDVAIKDFEAECAKSSGARPHMTIASFSMDDEEIKEISNHFEKLDHRYPAVRIPVKLRSQKTNNSITYSLIPTIEDSILIRVHDEIYSNVDNGYTRYRSIDEPGKWRPHVSMFSVSVEKERQAVEWIEKAKKIDTLTIKGFTLVSFPIKYLKEIQVSLSGK